MMNDDDLKIEELLQKGWIKVWMIFEVQAVDKSVCVSSLKKHVGEMAALDYVEVVKEAFEDVDKIEAPEALKQRGVKALFAQVCEVTLMARDFEGLVDLVINYAPSAVEIMAPEKITITMRNAQNCLASVADMMHKFASAGVGGMLIKGG